MENKITTELSPSSTGARVIEYLFIAFLFIVLVGLAPFSEREVIQDITETASDIDILRQAITALISSGIIIAWYRGARNKSILNIVSIPVAFVITWCAITLFWSPAPTIGFRRLALTSLVIITIFTAVDAIGVDRTLALFTKLLLFLVGCSLISGLVIPTAVHQIGELDAELVGAWRGIFYHKNLAGFVAAASVVASFFIWRRQRKKKWLFYMLCGCLLLLLSNSKTSILLLVPSVLAGKWLGEKLVSHDRRSIFLPTFLLFLCLLLLLFGLNNERLFELINNPASFTGRAEIWSVLGSIILDNPFGGVGFASLYGVSYFTPLLDYASGWVLFVAHGHNGYLDILATTGLIGLLLCIYAFFVIPVFQLVKLRDADSDAVGLLLALVFFISLHNMFESSVLDRASVPWTTLLIVCAIVRCKARRSEY